MLGGVATFAALGVAIVRVAGGDGIGAETVLTFLVFAIAFGWIHLALRQWAPNASPLLLPISAVLTALGIVEIYRLDPESATRQRWWLLIAAGFAIATLALLRTNGVDVLSRYRYLSLTGALVLFLLPLIPSSLPIGGVSVNGSRLWLQLEAFNRVVVRFQPAEFGKVLLVIFLASYLASRQTVLSTMTRSMWRLRLPEPRQLLPLVLAWVISLVVLIYQRDLGASLLLLAVFVTMLYATTNRASYLVAGGVLFLAGAVVGTRVFDHVQRRIDAWLRPWDDVADVGFQITQSLFALGSGSLTGSGLGLGRPDYIPSATTDFIFAALAEEIGLAGAIGIVATYALLLAVGFGIALQARDPFRKLLATGLTVTLAIQTIIIVAGVVRLLPLTGVALPFISYGGSALVANLVVIALLARISHEVSP